MTRPPSKGATLGAYLSTLHLLKSKWLVFNFLMRPLLAGFERPLIRTKAEDYRGTAELVRTQADLAVKGVKSINIEMTFEEAVRFSLAVQSCLLALNRSERSTVVGRETGMLLSIKTDSNTVTVTEKRVQPPERGGR
jgi:hypothetical protein